MAKFAFTFMETRIEYSPVSGTPGPVALPFCKSISARAVCLDYLAGRPVRMHPRPNEDERAIAGALAGIGGSVCIGESGTALRFVTAVAASVPGATTLITGTGARIMHRPIRPLLHALRALGAPEPELEEETLLIQGSRLRSRGEITIDASASSQFVSALLLIGPRVEGGLRLRLTGTSVSVPYISMTLRLMEAYGIRAHAESDMRLITVPEGDYAAPGEYICEPDWSSASYFYELGLLTGTTIHLPGLVPHGLSLQGDSVCSEIFDEIASRPALLDIDMADCPDLVPAVAATCAGLGLPFRLKGLAHLRHKESDRLAALSQELHKLGADVVAGPGSLTMNRPSTLTPPASPLSAHADHRIIMALAPLASVVPGIRFDSDGEETAKSFPGFWEEMAKCGLRATHHNHKRH